MKRSGSHLRPLCRSVSVLFALATLLTVNAIPPPTLSEYIAGSTDIFVGQIVPSVSEQSLKTPDGDDFAYRAVTVRVDEVLKGSLAIGTTVPMMVRSDLTDGPVLVMGQGAGRNARRTARYELTESAMYDAVVTRFREIIAIQEIDDELERKTAMAEWVVACIETESLQSEAISELAEGPWQYLKRTRSKVRLTDSQCGRLSRVLVTMPVSAPLREYLADQIRFLCASPGTPN